jgi:hypothetical protein
MRNYRTAIALLFFYFFASLLQHQVHPFQAFFGGAYCIADTGHHKAFEDAL